MQGIDLFGVGHEILDNDIERLLMAQRLAEHDSHDSETKCGAIVFDNDGKRRGSGANKFPHYLNRSDLPTTRPGKYKWILHAEELAIFNMYCDDPTPPYFLYCTGRPCDKCLLKVVHARIDRVYHTPWHGSNATYFDDEFQKELCNRSGLDLIEVKL